MKTKPVPRAKIIHGPMKAGTLDIGMKNPAVDVAEDLIIFGAKKAMAKKALTEGVERKMLRTSRQFTDKIDPSGRYAGAKKSVEAREIAKKVVTRVGAAASADNKKRKKPRLKVKGAST